jgi:hypothetical protein
VKLDIAPGKYIFNLNLSTLHPEDYAQLDVLSKEDFKEKLVSILGVKPAGMIEVLPQNNNKVMNTHGGLCDLAGELQFYLLSENQFPLADGQDQ